LLLWHLPSQGPGWLIDEAVVRFIPGARQARSQGLEWLKLGPKAGETAVRPPKRASEILGGVLRKPWVVCLVLFLVAFVPRAMAAGAYVTVDEEHWIARSVDFIYGVLNGDLAVVPSVHPGVTVLWGFGAFLLARFSLTGDLSALFQMRADGYYDVPNLLPTAAMFTVLVTSLTVVASYLLVRRLAGKKLALLAALLIALDPYFLTHSRRVHLDAVLASMMYLSALSLLVYVGEASPSRRYVLLSGIFAGLAWLTKVTAAYLIPFTLLALAGHLVTTTRGWRPVPAAMWREGKSFLVWAVAGCAILFLLWPAMWVRPAFALGELVRGVRWGVAVPHGASGSVGDVPVQFFWGKVVSDPGPGFYPLSSLYRVSPIVFLFFPVSIVSALVGQKRGWLASSKALAFWLGVAYIAFYVVMISLGAKKLESYVLPIFPMLDTLAAVGLFALLRRLAQRKPGPDGVARQALFPVLYAATVVGIVLTSIVWLRLVPHYSAYFNPLLGGVRTASRLLAFGGGEGLDAVAGYLNQKEDAESLIVSTPYDRAVFRYYFEGTAQPPSRKHWTGSWLLSDYVIWYLSYAQRDLPAPEIVALLESLEPEYVARINGIDYARVYEVPPLVTENVPPISHPASVNLDDQVTFLGYDLDTAQVESGGEIGITLYWQGRQSLDTDYSTYLRLINGVYDVWAQQDGGPLHGMMPTSRWDEGMVITDERRLQVLPGTPPGTYQIAVGVYDPATLHHLDPVGQGEELLLGPVEVARGLAAGPPAPQHPLEANLDDQIRLVGYDLEGQPEPGGSLHLTLFWQALSTPQDDYTVFVHLVGGDGLIMGQQDSQPVSGFHPTSDWTVGEFVRDQYHLTISEASPPGEYSLSVGMYRAGTGDRLPLLDERGEVVGDSIVASSFRVGQP
jgi:hypothetical protein